MAYGRRRYRYSRNYRYSQASHRQSVSRLYGGIDDDVRRMFFDLDAFTLKLVLNRYECEHGYAARKYAEKTLAKWKNGEVRMSGQVAERLVNVVPFFLSIDQKYELISSLWKRTRSRQTMRLAMNPADSLAQLVERAASFLVEGSEVVIPDSVADRLEWLAAEDSASARVLLEEVVRRESGIAIAEFATSLGSLRQAWHDSTGARVKGQARIELPWALVEVILDPSQPRQVQQSLGSTMSQDGSNQSDREKSSRDLQRIQNPNDLLAEAVNRLPLQKQEELLDKAAKEALRLQIKRRESVDDSEISASKVDDAVNHARHLSQTGQRFEYSVEHRSEQGSSRLVIQNRQPSVSERVGKCFVVTACYGDEEHFAVLSLRSFRDELLASFGIGRVAMRWYQQVGPGWAAIVEERPVICAIGRMLLWPFAILAHCIVRVHRLGARLSHSPR